MPPADLISKSLVTHNAMMFVSEPLPKRTEFSGLFSGRLDFAVNKMDMDLNIMLYERLASGEYIRLFNPGLSNFAQATRKIVCIGICSRQESASN